MPNADHAVSDVANCRKTWKGSRTRVIGRHMKTKILFLAILAFLFHTNSIEAQKKRPVSKAKVLSSRQIAEKVMPSVVLIITQDENGNPISQGSGFVFKSGLVVSNLHVFERASNAIVKNVKTGEISKAVEVVGMNARQDICIIRIDNIKFPVIETGDSHAVKTGDDVYVASNPKGLEGSFTKGIISSVRERNRGSKGDDELIAWAMNINGQTDRTLFQIDAAISPGSSGGSLLNSNGEVIGIVRSSLVSGQNLNFAIPIDQLLALEKTFKHPILLAGTCAYNDRLKMRLSGPVKTIKEILIDQSTGTERVDAFEEFDYFGNNIRSVIYGSEKMYDILREFDENGLLTHITYLRPGQKDVSFSSRKEDSIKEKIDSRKYSGIFEDLNESLKFDHLGNKLRSVLVTDDKQSVVTEYKYDDSGRPTFMKEFLGDKIWSTRYNYRFDRVGNWIRQGREVLARTNGEWLDPGIFVTREITYHP